jgi:hypothetical protein
VNAGSQLRQLRGVFAVEGDVETLCRHRADRTRHDTARVHQSIGSSAGSARSDSG